MADLRTDPDIQAEAERRARLFWTALGVHVSARIRFPATEWDACPEPDVTAAWTEAHLDLLLTDPDALSRLLAARVGVVVGATAPEWRRFRLGLPNGSESWAWALLGTPGEQFFLTDGNAPGISTILDPLPALHAAIAATEPRNAHV